MKELTCFFLLMMTSIASTAQSNVTIGKPYEVIDARKKEYFTKDNQILAFKAAKDNLILQKFDAVKLTLLKTTPYEELPKKSNIEKVIEFNGGYYLFYSRVNEGKKELISREIDFATGTFVGKDNVIITIDEVPDPDSWGGFFFGTSYDESVLLIQYMEEPETKRASKNNRVVGLYVFGKGLKKQWNSLVEMPYTDKKMDNIDYSLDSKGNVYIVARVFNDETRKRSKGGDPNYHLEILKVMPGATTATSTSLGVSDKFVHSVWLYENANGYMLGAGFYNKGRVITGSGYDISTNEDSADGVSVFKLSEDGKTSDQYYYEIPLEILNQYEGRGVVRDNVKAESKQKAQMAHMDLNNVVMNRDGSMVLFGEQKYAESSTSRNSSGIITSSSTTYFADNILVTKIGSDGKLNWMTKIPKRNSTNSGYIWKSYKYFSGSESGDHYFVLLDNVHNEALTIDKVPATHMIGAGGFLTVYQINNNTGELTRKSLMDTRNANGTELFQINPDRILSPLPNTIVVEAYKKNKEDVLVKVVLDYK